MAHKTPTLSKLCAEEYIKHTEHLHEHIKYGLYSDSIDVKSDNTPLPTDKRKKPHPLMKKMGITANTWGEYEKRCMDTLMDSWRKHIYKHMAETLLFVTFNASTGKREIIRAKICPDDWRFAYGSTNG